MKFSHCEDERGDRHLDILTDEENGLESSSRERTLSKSRSKRRTLCGGVAPMADRFYAWDRVGGLPIITNSVRFKIRKASKQLDPATLSCAASIMTSQLASFD